MFAFHDTRPRKAVPVDLPIGYSGICAAYIILKCTFVHSFSATKLQNYDEFTGTINQLIIHFVAQNTGHGHLTSEGDNWRWFLF